MPSIVAGAALRLVSGSAKIVLLRITPATDQSILNEGEYYFLSVHFFCQDFSFLFALSAVSVYSGVSFSQFCYAWYKKAKNNDIRSALNLSAWWSSSAGPQEK
jgi:hypothetical protein